MILPTLPPLVHNTKDPEILRADKFQFQAVSTHEIRRMIMFLSSNMAPRHDEITMSVIKDAVPYILPVLTDIVNRSSLSSVFPSD